MALATEKVVMHDDGDYKFTLELHRRMAYFHLEVKRWNKTVFRKIRDNFPAAVRECERIGCRRLRAICPLENRLLPKFASRFGFREVQRCGRGFLLER